MCSIIHNANLAHEALHDNFYQSSDVLVRQLFLLIVSVKFNSVCWSLVVSLLQLSEEMASLNGSQATTPTDELKQPNGRPKRQRRLRVPDKPNYPINLWSIMKNCIGKELSKIPMPVSIVQYEWPAVPLFVVIIKYPKWGWLCFFTIVVVLSSNLGKEYFRIWCVT